MLRKLVFSLFLLLGPHAFAYPPMGAWCLNPSGSWIPAAMSAIGTIYPGTPPGNALYGSSNGGNAWYPLQCDANGNLQTSMGNYAIAPATCSTGQTYFNTANSTPYYCSAPNTWTAFGSGGGMTWPAAAGIMVYAGGSAYGISLTAPAGTIVGTTDTQTLTNKTLDGVTPTTMAFVDATSSIQTQLNGKQASGTYVTPTTLNNGSLPGLFSVLGANTEYSNGTCTTAKTVTPVNGNMQNVTLTNSDACALTFTQPSSGTASITLKVIQSSTSTFNGTISGCKWPAKTVPTITATTGAIDFVSIYLDGTNAFCAILQNFG